MIDMRQKQQQVGECQSQQIPQVEEKMNEALTQFENVCDDINSTVVSEQKNFMGYMHKYGKQSEDLQECI